MMKIKMNGKYHVKSIDIVKNMLLTSIVLSSTQIITTPIGGLSIFQLFVLLTGIIGCIILIQSNRIKTGSYLLFLIMAFFSSILAFILSTNKSWGRSYLLLGILQTMLMLLICNFFELSDLNKLLKAIVRSQYITFLMSAYSVYKFYFGGGIPNKINLGAGFFIDLGEEYLLRAQAAGQIRLSLPFPTPPVLSVVMAMVIIILIFNKDLYRKSERILLICGYSVIMLLTGSRTGMAALVMALGLNYLFSLKAISLKSIKRYYIVLIGIMIIAFAAFLYRFYNSEYFIKLLNRFAITNIMEDRHLLVPLDGLIIWLSSVKNFILGIGFGSSINMMGEHTYLPPYFLNSFITYIVERGIMGGIMVFQILGLLRYKSYIKRKEFAAYKALYVSFLAALCSAVFYETFNCYIIIFVFAIMFMCSQNFMVGKVRMEDGYFISNNSGL